MCGGFLLISTCYHTQFVGVLNLPDEHLHNTSRFVVAECQFF